MSKDEDLSWIDSMVHPNLSYWAVDRPVPQNKASLLRWNRYDSSSGTILEQEIFPISATITVMQPSCNTPTRSRARTTRRIVKP